MPVYTYRREDGTTFDIRQSFSDSPLNVDPETGQKVVRLIQNTGVIFKGSGFYVNDSKSASKKSLSNGNGASTDAGKDAGAGDTAAKSETKTETAKSETTTATTTASSTSSSASSTVSSAAAAD